MANFFLHVFSLSFKILMIVGTDDSLVTVFDDAGPCRRLLLLP